MRICYLIPKLGIGGAERQLYYLVREISKRHYVIVVTFYTGGELWDEFVNIPNVRLISLDRRNRWGFSIIKKIKDILKDNKIEIIQNYLPPIGFIGILAGLWAKTPVRINTIRCTNMDYTWFGPVIYFYLERMMSNRFADIVISNSESGKKHHISKGYREEKVIVIYNGIDIGKFKNNSGGELKKKELGICEGNKIVGIIARIDPMKDHETFLKAAKIVNEKYKKVNFVIIGDGDSILKKKLVILAQQLEIEQNVLFLGHRNDIPELLDMMDIVISSSYGEGFSNSIAEAMAAGKPVVVTDVGDMKDIVGDGECGYVVPPRNPELLAQKIKNLICNENLMKKMGCCGVLRIKNNYPVEKMTALTEDVYIDLLRGKKKSEIIF